MHVGNVLKYAMFEVVQGRFRSMHMMWQGKYDVARKSITMQARCGCVGVRWKSKMWVGPRWKKCEEV